MFNFSERFTPPLEKQDDVDTSLTFALSPRVNMKSNTKIKSHGLALGDLLGVPALPSRPGTGLENLRNQSLTEHKVWEFKERP